MTNGLLDFATPASQTETVQSVAKSSSYFHFNNYLDIATWATDGLIALRKVYRQCSPYAGGIGKGPDLVVMDDDTYANFEETRRSQIRISMVEDKTSKSNMLGLELGVAKVYSSIDLDRGDFSGAAADGVTYMLNTDYFEFPMHEAPQIGKFEESVGDQDVVTALFSMQGNLICTKLPAQGVVSGGSA